MNRPRNILLLGVGGFALAACASPTLAQGEWVLIDRELREHRVEVTQLRQGSVTYTDASGRARTDPLTAFVGLLHERPSEERPARELPWITQQMQMFNEAPVEVEEPPEPFAPWIELTNGERWSGSLAGADGDTLSWRLASSITRDIALDRVRVAAIAADPGRESWPGVDDRVVLVNGDVIDGFISSVGPLIRVETEGNSVDIPGDRIGALLLANPPTPPRGVVVWLGDGSIIAAASVEVAVTGRVSIALGSEASESMLYAAAADVLGVLLEPAGLTGLATLPPASVAFPRERPWGRPPVSETSGPLWLGAIDTLGPLTVSWDLPRPAARLGATATLPPAMWAWGDCEVVVRAGDGSELLRERLRAERPSVEISLPLGGLRRISIEVVSGASGPVQDRVVLVRPMIRWVDPPSIAP